MVHQSFWCSGWLSKYSNLLFHSVAKKIKKFLLILQNFLSILHPNMMEPLGLIITLPLTSMNAPLHRDSPYPFQTLLQFSYSRRRAYYHLREHSTMVHPVPGKGCYSSHASNISKMMGTAFNIFRHHRQTLLFFITDQQRKFCKARSPRDLSLSSGLSHITLHVFLIAHST